MTQLPLEPAQATPSQLTLHNPTPQQLIAQGIDKGISVEQLERLMDLQERYLNRQARISFFNALSAFQHECPNLQKTKNVDFTSKSGGRVNYTFVPLAEIRDTIKEPIHRAGLTYRWEIEDKGTQLSVTCILTHVDGHSERTTMTAGADDSGNKNAIQSRGSTITYLQRYTLIGALGITSADPDKDGRGSKDKAQLHGTGPRATADNIKSIIVKINKGEATIEKAKGYYTFDDAQIKTLEIAENNYKKKQQTVQP